MADLNRDACEDIAVLLGESATHHGVDVANESSVESMVDEVINHHQVIDVLVNCAGILDETPFLDMSAETFDRMISINLRGAFLVGRYVAAEMAKQKSGRIINISSQLALKGGVAYPTTAQRRLDYWGLLNRWRES